MKVLKVAAIVIGAAALAFTGVGLAAGFTLGASLGALGGVAGAIGLSGLAATAFTGLIAGAVLYDVASLANLVLPKPSQGGNQIKWKPDPYAGIPYAMGRTLVGGNIVYRRGSGGDNTYEQFATVLSLGPAQSIDTTFLNKTTVGFGGDGSAQGTYNGQVWQRTQLGACPEAAALTPGAGAAPGWTAQHKLSGLAATFLTFKYDTRTTNGLTTEPSPGWIGHWVKVYDPRLDSTYPGGNGPCRAFDESTYVWSEDPHLHGLTWAMGRYQNGVRVAGIGAGNPVPGGSVTAVDVASFVEGANLNDARGWKIGGQVVTRPDTLWNSLKSMLQAGGAQPTLVGGVITSINRAPRVSLATITRSDIVGKCTFSATQPRRARINGIIPQYRSEAHDWEMVSASEVSVPAYVALDGDERTKELAYPLVQDVNQVAQLAAYDVCDAREAGPGSIPLKPWWLNYKIGDCVTFSPEDGFSIKVMINGRSIEAQSGVVTYTVRGETDAKHSFALGMTGNAPPIVSLVYSTGVAAPAATDWMLSGVALSSGGASIPAIHIAGAVGNPNADAVIFEYRLDGTAAWSAASVEAAATTDKVISSVAPGATYDAAVSYRVRGVVGDRLLLGPVVAGSLQTSGGNQSAIATSFPIGLTITAAADGTVTISDHTRRYTDGHADVAVTGATIASGLAPGTFRGIGYDDPDRAGGAVTYQLFANDIDARVSPANPGRHYVGYVTIPTAGSPPADGGGASPPGGNCVTVDTPVMMADGSEKPAGQIVVGDRLWTRHENHLGDVGGGWGFYPVEAVSIADSADVWQATIGGRTLNVTGDHLVYTGTWVAMRDIGQPAAPAKVVKMTVTSAHTYVSNGILSHNIKNNQPLD